MDSEEEAKVGKRGAVARNKRFNEQSIRGLKARSRRYEIAYDNGIRVRVTHKNVKTFTFLYRHEGRLRRLTLGTFPKMSVADANKALAAAQQMIEHGEDPAELAVEQHKAHREAMTAAELAASYIEKHAKPFKRSWREDQRILNAEIIPRWGKRRARSITKDDVLRMLDRLQDRGLRVGANRILAVTRKMFRWGASRNYVPGDPCALVKPPAPEVERQVHLNHSQIRAFWRGLDTAKITPQVRLALRMILVTGQRPGEVAGMAWPEIDRETSIWQMPGERTKNKRIHRVPLCSMALKLLREAQTAGTQLEGLRKAHFERTVRRRQIKGLPPPQEPKGTWVFPSRVGGHIKPTALGRALLRLLPEIGLPSFTPHDLRRTAATEMSLAGVPRTSISWVLNHTPQNVTDRHYIAPEHDPEKLDALTKWDKRLRSTLSAANA